MLPETRSDKITRHVLKVVILDRDPGDISTIEKRRLSRRSAAGVASVEGRDHRAVEHPGGVRVSSVGHTSGVTYDLFPRKGMFCGIGGLRNGRGISR